MKTAAEWFEQAMRDLGMTCSADSQSELRGDLERALDSLEQALAIDAAFPGAHYARGRALARLDRFEEAALALDVALAMEPANLEVQLVRAQVLEALHQKEPALSGYSAVLELAPLQPDALFSRAKLLSATGRHGEALAAWERILASPLDRNQFQFGWRHTWLVGDSRQQRARIMRASSLSQLRRPEAAAAWREVVGQEGTELTGPMASGAFLEAVRRHEDCRSAFRDYVDTHAEEPRTWRLASDVYASAGLHHESLVACRRLVEHCPQDSSAWCRLANAHLNLQQRPAAIAALETALALDPKNLLAKHRLAVARGEHDA